MSGRSAYVRKKITETKVGDKGVAAPRGRAKSSASSEENSTLNEYTLPVRAPELRERERERDRDITGVGTTNARFLKFAEPVREPDGPAYSSNNSSAGSTEGRKDHNAGVHRPLEDFAYARARKPIIKTEDVSGIEKSGLRSMLDKKSDVVRKGLAKTFAFNKKKDRRDFDTMDFRPQSSATVRPQGMAGPEPTDQDINYESQSQDRFATQHPSKGQGEQPWDSPAAAVSQPPSAPLPAIPAGSSPPPIKRWIGGGRPVQRWNKLRKDPELWDPNGDVLVFFGHRGQSPRPNPSFRLSSHIIEATESRFLVTLLRDGSTEEDIQIASSPVGAPPMLHRQGNPLLGAHYGQPHLSPGAYGRTGQPTPPVSEDASFGEADGQISYEMYFPSPPNGTKIDQLRYHITTRNIFALLYHASLVGFSLYQAISDLHLRLEAYMPSDADNVGSIINYLSARGIDDVRNDPETAVSLLAWSEGSDVRWEEGWRESFLHAAGLFSRLESTADFKHVTPITRALLERACLETELRVQAAEERLVEFEFSDMWPDAVATTSNAIGPVATAPAKAAADRLRKFLVEHYTRQFGRWPPLALPHSEKQDIGTAHGGGDGEEEDVWLTRTLAQALQRDFSALYDYLVNRDIIWDGSEARSGRKWMMVSKSGNRAFEADTLELPLTDMLIEFDNKLRFPHIPHPFPLVPDSIPPPPTPSAVVGGRENAGGGSNGLFGGKSANKKSGAASGNGNGNGTGNTGNTGRSGALERRIQLAYTESTNLCILGSEFTHSDLIDTFSKFEKTDRIGEVDPSTARRGRWVLVYGILQTLASVSVDAPNMRYRDDVSYHLSPRLKGAKVPPWKAGALGNRQSNDEAVHELSHCWTAPLGWATSTPNSGAESSAEEDAMPMRLKNNFSFPRPPTTASTAGSRAASMRTTSSVAPSMVGGYVPFHSGGGGGGGSAMSISESEAGSSIRTPHSSISGRGRGARDVGGGRSGRGMGMGRLDEYGSGMDGRDGGSGMTFQLGPLGNVSGTGGFLLLDDIADDRDHHSFVTAMSRADKDRTPKGGGLGRPILSGTSSETDSVAPVIRDFDDLDGLSGRT